jgi:hypothetical protein
MNEELKLMWKSMVTGFDCRNNLLLACNYHVNCIFHCFHAAQVCLDRTFHAVLTETSVPATTRPVCDNIVWPEREWFFILDHFCRQETSRYSRCDLRLRDGNIETTILTRIRFLPTIMADPIRLAAVLDSVTTKELVQKLCRLQECLDDDAAIQVLAKHAELSTSAPDYAQNVDFVQSEAPQRANAIFNRRERLQNIWSNRKEAIKRRWLERNPARRSSSKLGLECQLLIAPKFKHFGADRQVQVIDPSSSCLTSTWKTYRLPQICFRCCTQGHPSLFAQADMSTISAAIMANTVELLPSISGHSMLLEEGSVEEHRRLQVWTQDPDTAAAIFDGRAHPPQMGLIGLEIEEKILSFLVRCVELLLPDLDLTFSVNRSK